MKSWNSPTTPTVAGRGPELHLHNTATGAAQRIGAPARASLYVCGITPYDATHLGHAATYVSYDTLVRYWLDSGSTVTYIQNVTDIDDPLLERAQQTGQDWQELAHRQTELFRSDMAALRVIPPTEYVAVTEVISEIADTVDALRAGGYTYTVPSDNAEPDHYFDTHAAQTNSPWHLGQESRLSRPDMLPLSAERGGDPERPGKRDPLDPLLWRSARAGEPSWETSMGRGRPGWHIECTAIALTRLPHPITVNGGGSDLIFPHHEYSAAHGTALTHKPYAEIYSHSGMVGYHGEKMSKSLGNLVLVSALTAAGHHPQAIRLAILAHHYRSDWEWTHQELETATTRHHRWATWAAQGAAGSSAPQPDSTAAHSGSAVHPDSTTAHSDSTDPLIAAIRRHIANDLNTPAALSEIDDTIAAGGSATPGRVAAIDALLGITLSGTR